MGIVAANLRDWEQQPRNWRVLEPVNDPDHERYYRHNDTPALRVQVANRLETLLKAWDGKDETDYSGDCTLQPTTIAKIVETCLDDYEVLGLAGHMGLADSFSQWIQDNPTPCGATCTDDCAQACAAGAI
jgi:hypothetical protein